MAFLLSLLPQYTSGPGFPPMPQVPSNRSPESAPRRAIVIGGSMSGLFAGLMLRADGWRVDIFEKVEGELSGRGAGIVAQPEILAILRGLGLTASELGVPVQQ